MAEHDPKVIEHDPKMIEHDPTMAEPDLRMTGHEPVFVSPPRNAGGISRRAKSITLLVLFAMLVWQVIEFVRPDEHPPRLPDVLSTWRAEQARSEELQRELGCEGDVYLGLCMDPPCIDSDANAKTAAIDPSYVPGNVKVSGPLPISRHRIIEDACINASDLREGTCKLEPDAGAPVAELIVIHCDHGCSDGACVRP